MIMVIISLWKTLEKRSDHHHDTVVRKSLSAFGAWLSSVLPCVRICVDREGLKSFQKVILNGKRERAKSYKHGIWVWIWMVVSDPPPYKLHHLVQPHSCFPVSPTSWPPSLASNIGNSFSIVTIMVCTRKWTPLSSVSIPPRQNRRFDPRAHCPLQISAKHLPPDADIHGEIWVWPWRHLQVSQSSSGSAQRPQSLFGLIPLQKSIFLPQEARSHRSPFWGNREFCPVQIHGHQGLPWLNPTGSKEKRCRFDLRSQLHPIPPVFLRRYRHRRHRHHG